MARRSPSLRRANAAPAASAPREPPAMSASKKSGAWAEPTPAQIARSIDDSALPLQIALEIALDGGSNETARLPLVSVGVHAWQELVALQCAVDAAARPTRPTRRRDGSATTAAAMEEDALECMVFAAGGRPELQLSQAATNSVHKFATSLSLRLQSLGLAVRSVLKERVLLRLPAGSAAVNVRKDLPWNALVVVAASRAENQADDSFLVDVVVQRVELPPVRAVADPLAKLRHPQLVATVDALLAAHTATGRSQVVILRGIPGSGKSTLGRDIVAVCGARGVTPVVCSADFYFETPRGYQFDVKGISKAHEASQRQFRGALADHRAPIVVVDNTHTQRWEYEPYETTAAAYACGVHVLEMHCPDVLTCVRMAQRNSHGVGAVKVLAMYVRWEHDERATRFAPRFQDPLVLTNPVTRNPFHNYVAYVGLFLDAAGRRALLERVRPRHQTVIAEHVTLFFRPTTQYVRQAPIGKKYTVRVTRAVEDDHGQALEVELDDALPLQCRNKVPHITLSTAQGVNAFYSNELLDDPHAARADVEGFELELTLGIAVMAQNRKIVSLVSPLENQFVVDRELSDEVDSLVVLGVDESDLLRLRGAETPCEPIARTLLRHELVRHSMGPHATTRRVVVVRRSTGSSASIPEDAVKTTLEKYLSPWFSMCKPSQSFEQIAFIDGDQGGSLAAQLKQRVAVSSSTFKRATLLSTRPEALQVDAFAGLADVVTVKRLPVFGGDERDAISRLPVQLDTSLTRTLDAMDITTTEEACFVVQRAVLAAETALAACGAAGGATVKRIDSTLWTTPSAEVVIATDATISCSLDDLQSSFIGQGIKQVVVTTDGDNEKDDEIKFQLPTKGTISPVIRWVITRPGRVSTLGARVALVDHVRRSVRDALSVEGQEAYPRVVGVIATVLRGKSSDQHWRAVAQLVSERAVLEFLRTHEATAEKQAAENDGKAKRPVDHRVLWSQIVDCIRWLATWPSQRWTTEVETLATRVNGAEAAQRLAQFATERVRAVVEAVSAAAGDAIHADELSEPSGGIKWGVLVERLLQPAAEDEC